MHGFWINECESAILANRFTSATKLAAAHESAPSRRTSGFESYELGPGDSIAFDSSTPHEYLNKTDDYVHVIRVVIHPGPGRGNADFHQANQPQVAVWSVITRAGWSWPVTASRRMGGGCQTSVILVAFGTCVQARPRRD